MMPQLKPFDHGFLRSLNVEWTEDQPRQTVLEQMYDNALTAYDRLNAECAEAHRQVKRLRVQGDNAAKAYYRANLRAESFCRKFRRASWVAGIMALAAIVGWLR